MEREVFEFSLSDGAYKLIEISPQTGAIGVDVKLMQANGGVLRHTQETISIPYGYRLEQFDEGLCIHIQRPPLRLGTLKKGFVERLFGRPNVVCY